MSANPLASVVCRQIDSVGARHIGTRRGHAYVSPSTPGGSDTKGGVDKANVNITRAAHRVLTGDALAVFTDNAYESRKRSKWLNSVKIKDDRSSADRCHHTLDLLCRPVPSQESSRPRRG